MSKKYLYILLLILLVLAAIATVYWFLFGQSTAEPVQVPTSGFGSNPEGRSVGEQEEPDTWQDNVRVRIRRISDVPVSGFTLNKNLAGQEVVRYVERQTGHIQEEVLDSAQETRVSNTTIPSSQEVFWTTGGRVLFRFLDSDNETIRSFSASTTNNGDVEGLFLGNNFVSMAADPEANRIFYILDEDVGAAGYLANPDGSKSQQIFSHFLKEWLVQWPSSQFIYLTTKASALVEGVLFSLNTKTGEVHKVLGGIPGLTTLVNPSGSRVLYSYQQDNGSVGLVVYDVKKETFRDLQTNSLAEKCVWKDDTIVVCAVPQRGFRGSFPDVWYQGKYFFTDDLWDIDTTSGTTTQLASLTDVEPVGIDGVDLKISGNGTYLGFINKRDLSLWSVRLGDATSTPPQ